MAKWEKFKDHSEAWKEFSGIAKAIAEGKLHLGRGFYAQSVLVGVLEAILCRRGKISIAEFGVWKGDGLRDLCKAAKYFHDEYDMEITVYGLDNLAGLPEIQGHKDHPEFWRRQQFTNPDPAATQASLPDFAKMIIGDVGDTIGELANRLEDAPLAFVSIDLDLYSSTKAAMPLFTYKPMLFLPAMPMYFDDMDFSITFNDWCGEQAAVREFNEENELRKIQRNTIFKIRSFHVLHVLDHPMRTGELVWPGQFPLWIPCPMF